MCQQFIPDAPSDCLQSFDSQSTAADQQWVPRLACHCLDFRDFNIEEGGLRPVCEVSSTKEPEGF